MFKPKNIKFSEEEKREFDDLLGELNNGEYTIYQVFDNVISTEYYSASKYSNLYRRLFYNSTTAEDNKNQIEFVRAIEHPELIEVVKEKKYRFPLGLKTSDGEMQYLSYKHGCYFASRRDNKLKQIFTESETKTLHFAAINLEDCKEEVKWN